MKNYKLLAIRYLQLNKRRTRVTIFGVIVATTVLYIMLNLGWSALLHYRDTIRKDQDYEIVLFTETQEQIDQVLADDRVKSAYVGTYYDYDYENPINYNNALYINTNNPYRMDRIREQLQSAYGVEGEENEELAWTYMQGGEGNTTVIVILSLLLVSFIFAIFGVGIVRNSIQLSTLEQIKDCGNLRCIGATKQELKSIIYLEGAILEIGGMIGGIMIGTVCGMLIGHFMKIDAGFHVIPIVPIAVAFLGDLMFAMEENCKIITNMSPVSAIRGEYRIRKEKIKLRKSSIFGKFFGIEGDYAYKSIMRNPGRFWKTVWSLGIGMGAFIMVVGILTSFNKIVDEEEQRWKYYHVFYESILEPWETKNEAQSMLPPTGILGRISDLKELTEAKRIYSANVVLADEEAFFEHYTDDYLTKSSNGVLINSLFEIIRESAEEKPSLANLVLEISCYGYDETDYQRYEKALTAGTLDVSDNGIVLVNHETLRLDDSQLYDSETVEIEYADIDYTDFQVGDTINLVDMEKLRALVEEKQAKLDEEYDVKKEKSAMGNGQEDTSEEEQETQRSMEYDSTEYEYRLARIQIMLEARKQLLSEGAYKTYTIEGIVEEDVNHYTEGLHFILPLEQYYALTGTDESMSTGMQYHFDKFPTRDFSEIQDAINLYLWDEDMYCAASEYQGIMYMIDYSKRFLLGVMLAVLFVVTMTTLNIINTTASSLHLRKKEFAQLRVIGISKKRLMKMVMLEGVIAAIVANVIGIGIGVLLSFNIFRLIVTTLSGYKYSFPVLGVFIGMLASILILCGSVYMPLRGLKQDVASDLSAGGD